MLGSLDILGFFQNRVLYTGCPNKHGNSVTNSISSLLWISIVIPNFKIKSEDGQVYSVCTTVSSLNINKQIVNIADKNLTDYSFLNRYHYTKSKNYLKRRFRIRHWISMFIGTLCTQQLVCKKPSQKVKQCSGFFSGGLALRCLPAF